MVPERPSILVIDPDPSIRTLILALARRQGLDADGAADSEEALFQWRCRHYCAVVVEPRIHGSDALLRELAAAAESRPKIIVATTPRPFGDVNRWPEAETVLMKPFDIEELSLTMAACCAQNVA